MVLFDIHAGREKTLPAGVNKTSFKLRKSLQRNSPQRRKGAKEAAPGTEGLPLRLCAFAGKNL